MQLKQVYQKLELSEDLALFNDDKIVKVEVCPSEKSWTIHLLTKAPYSSEQKNKIVSAIKSAYSNLNSVDLMIKSNQPAAEVCLKKVCQESWESLVAFLKNKLPIATGYLKNSSYQVDLNNLTIYIQNEIGVSLLASKASPLISDWFMDNYNQSVKVIFTVTENSSPCEELERIKKEKITQLASYQSSKTESLSASKPNKSNNSSNIILGKKVSLEPVAVKNIIEEERQICLQGNIFSLEEITFKTGRKLVTFNITDNTDSITVKAFSPDKGEYDFDRLKNGIHAKVQGAVKFDTYVNELVLMANHIEEMSPSVKTDDAPEKRIELHLHTKSSSMDGVSSLEAYISRAASMSHPAIAITDHGVAQSFPDAADLGEKYGVKIIYGIEGYLVDDTGKGKEFLKGKSYHVIILVKNYTGLKNLYHLISLSHLEYFYRTPRIPKSVLAKHREGLIIGSACEAGEVISNYLANQSSEQLEKTAAFYDYLEVQPIGNNEFLIRNGTATEEKLQEMNLRIIQLGEKLNKPVVATGDVHFLEQHDSVYREILMKSKGYSDAENQPPLFFRSTEEMLSEFDYLDANIAKQIVIENPNYINDQIESIKPIPDDFFPPHIDGAEDQIIDMTMGRAKELYGDKLPDVVSKRIKKELDSIINNGFAVLYLISHKLVKKSIEDGYLVGSRGSVGSSLVATLTEITEVNPLPPHYRCPECKYSEFIDNGSVGSGTDLPDKKCPQCNCTLVKDGHDIPFEVFLGFKGDKVPDIDLNFSGEYQGQIMKYTEDLFGKDYVFRAGTIATVAERTAYGFVKKYLDETNQSARSAEINRLVKGCTGVTRTTGQHPGGLMVVPKDYDIYDFTPIQRPANDQKSSTITTHFDYHAISSRLVKLDILGHDDPTAIKMLEDLTGVNATEIPFDEAKTMSLFSGVDALGVTEEEIRSKVGTFGIPEFGTKFVRQMLEDTKPTTFSELLRISGLSHGTDVWLNNAQELIQKGIAQLAETISTRDDIMVFLIYNGMEPTVAFKIMEGVRKGKGLTPEQEAAMRDASVPEWYIESCKKIKYMFPKAHAVAYVMMAFRIAYFKVYYPSAFYATFFTVRADEFDADIICQGKEPLLNKIEEYEKKGNDMTTKEKNMLVIMEVALEMYCRGLKLRRVSLAESEASEFKLTETGILPPLASLQGVGKSAAQNIVNARKKQSRFNSVEDLRIASKVSKTVIEALEQHGCLKDLPATSQLELF